MIFKHFNVSAMQNKKVLRFNQYYVIVIQLNTHAEAAIQNTQVAKKAQYRRRKKPRRKI